MAEIKDTPEYRSDAYEALHQKWAFVDTLLGGTKAMREASYATNNSRTLTRRTNSPVSMLVQFPGEDADDFAARVAMATYDDDYRDALDALVGALLRKPPTLGDDVPAAIVADLEDADLRGTHINVFAQRLARKGAHQGAAYVLVEKPPLPDTNGQPLRESEAERLGLRPYCVLYGAADLQDAPRYVTINGRKVLQQIVFRECADVPDGQYRRKEVERYRVYRLPVEQLPNRQWARTGNVEWELWEETENQKGEKEAVQVDSGTHALLKEIPVAVFNANPDVDDECQTAGPVFYELGELSRLVFNFKSDYHRSVHLTASPIPTLDRLDEEATGKNPDGSFSFSVNRALVFQEGGSFRWGELSGNGLASYVTCVENAQGIIRKLSYEALYADATITTTATEQLLRACQRATRLAQMEQALHDCLENVLKFMGQWRNLGDDAGGSITMAGASDAVILSDSQLATMMQEVVQGVTSRETYWTMKQKAGLLPDDFDAAKEAALLDAEAEKAADRQARAFDAGQSDALDQMDAASGMMN